MITSLQLSAPVMVQADRWATRSKGFLASLFLGILLLSGGPGQAQQLPVGDTTALPASAIELDNITVAPLALDTKGWLLLNPDIALELDGAVHNLYNFKFDRADRQFRSLRRRYPQHPMPYFLLGLSTWWKLMGTNLNARHLDAPFYAFLDTAITKANVLQQADQNNYEAAFFLAAAHGFQARLHAERRDWRKATVSSKRALTHLQKSREANGLSPEFVFGEALFNYYAVWIGEQYPWLRPVLLFFPKGNRERGLAQLESVARTAVYTAPEARYFRLRILGSQRENQQRAALDLARQMWREFPDNSCFARSYATYAFTQGQHGECEVISRDILSKLNKGQVGYDSFSGRMAAYYLGFMAQDQGRNLAIARDYYQRCVVFSEAVGPEARQGFYLFALAALGRMAASEHDLISARRYFEQVLSNADRSSALFKEARTFLRQGAKHKVQKQAEMQAYSN